jgi:hypothetical protein
MRVKATREGLVGQKTASGYIVDEIVPYCALPAVEALQRFVKITNLLNGHTAIGIVLDVGPFNTHDESYVFGGARPKAEFGVSISGDGTNGAGIDLGQRLWTKLGMTDNTDVDWEFLDVGDAVAYVKEPNE